MGMTQTPGIAAPAGDLISREAALLPCPFCGGTDITDEAYWIASPVEWFGKFKCNDCDTDGPLSQFKYDDRAEAVEDAKAMWNRRALPAAPEAGEVERLRAEIATWQQNSRETFMAMCAMRDAINEYIPLPSIESDLLHGPEYSVFCATVADAVIASIGRITDERDAQSAITFEAAANIIDSLIAGGHEVNGTALRRASGPAVSTAALERIIADRVQAALAAQGEPVASDVAELIEYLQAGVHPCGLHDDNSTEMYLVDDASEKMFEAAQLIKRLQPTARAERAESAQPVAQEPRTDGPDKIWAWAGDEQDGWENAYATVSHVSKEQVEYIRADLAHPSPASAWVTVKPLVWIENDDSARDCAWIDDFGLYQITDDFVLYIGHYSTGSVFNTIEAAQAAAQADYESRILAALSQPAQGRKGMKYD